MAFSANTSSEINVTPLIDVLLVLLIIFMVIVPLTPRGLDSSIPQGKSAAGPPLPPVTVRVVQRDPALPRSTSSTTTSSPPPSWSPRCAPCWPCAKTARSSSKATATSPTATSRRSLEERGSPGPAG